ncbi:acetyl-CoA carboxylase biotin carboxylase subunit [Aeromicrobium wangtongii]|uniref:acetyl-CoA carboxylase biotin carboxylase subunit n=1 Tax=Aeromicrobium wangtongii TaxID=2969247 RepID=UPI002016AAD0|nr:acetyl-CoA carboxylase biotin carboxylase subunit [Aeromicrobium wangtongii]MCL3818616.1 acetyl-CoA carboxylase biotin carboxylase subunit [Aeromicrobium wangtongii]
MPGLRRVLVANRGEIALRIIRACLDEGIESVLVVSEADRETAGAYLADRVVCIGPAPSTQSYLDVDRVMAAAVGTGCDGLHPGYGFLAERPELAQACADNGITFVGPDADTIRRGGDKILARALARDNGVPVGSGSDALDDARQARAIAEEVGYPVLLKAAAGGGGRGMVLVETSDHLEGSFAAASHEALQAFGDGRLYVERYIRRARHVEVQILGDGFGNIVHLGERDCSMQRRFQKIVEESPAYELSDDVRARLHTAALALTRALDYVGAATVEFIVDADTGDASFLEINTRVQVEHPVTEMVTGIDIVREQLRVAGGLPLSFTQDDVVISGHAIECRINAENPDLEFLPVPGTVRRWIPPQGGGARVDSHAYGGYTIPPYYDSMIAKVITHGVDRAQAIARMTRALDHLVIEGVVTNRDFLMALISHPDFVGQRHSTRWIEESYLASPV